MSEIVDKWVEILKGAPSVGGMTHRERLARALDLQETDLVPVAAEMDLFTVLDSGYDFHQVFNDAEKATDAILSGWARYRMDIIWPYTDMGHALEPLMTPDERADKIYLRGPRDYVMFKPVTTDIDEAIARYEQKVWLRHGSGRGETHFAPHFEQLIEFQQKMGGTVPVGAYTAAPSNMAESTVEVQNFIRWTVTEPKAKVHRYLEAATQYVLDGLEGMRDLPQRGVEFILIFGGARTWGPRQLDEFAKYDRMVAEKAAEIFPYPMWHLCGHNLPHFIDMLADFPIKGLQYDEPMPQLNMSYADWFEFVAKRLQGKVCAMNAPTTQLALHGSADEVGQVVSDFISHTRPYTTVAVMPGCEMASGTPRANVEAMFQAARGVAQ